MKQPTSPIPTMDEFFKDSSSESFTVCKRNGDGAEGCTPDNMEVAYWCLQNASGKFYAFGKTHMAFESSEDAERFQEWDFDRKIEQPYKSQTLWRGSEDFAEDCATEPVSLIGNRVPSRDLEEMGRPTPNGMAFWLWARENLKSRVYFWGNRVYFTDEMDAISGSLYLENMPALDKLDYGLDQGTYPRNAGIGEGVYFTGDGSWSTISGVSGIAYGSGSTISVSGTALNGVQTMNCTTLTANSLEVDQLNVKSLNVGGTASGDDQ